MGSAPSKIKKKNRNSTQSLSRKSKKKSTNNNNNSPTLATATPAPGCRPRALSEASVVPQVPPHWGSGGSSSTTPNNNNNNNNKNIHDLSYLNQKELPALEESVHYSPMNNYDNKDLYQGQGHVKSTTSSAAHTDGQVSARNSSENVTPQANSTTKPRTYSSGLPSFSLLKGRKSNPTPRRRQDTEPYYPHNKPFEISSPIIESKVTMGAGNYSRDPSFGSLSTEQPVPPRRNPRRSLDANQHQQQTNAYIEPPKPSTGAYKAPVPSIPTSSSPSAQQPQQQRQSFDSHAAGQSYPPPPGSTALTSSFQDQPSLWKETTLRNANNAAAASLVSATAAEGRKIEPTGGEISRSESIHSQNSRASSLYSNSGYTNANKNMNKDKNKPISGSTFASTLSPSPSNASQSSFTQKKHGQRSSKTYVAHPDGPAESSRLNTNQIRLYLQGQQHETSFASASASENASTLSLPGSRYLGDNSSCRSTHTDRNASEISLAGSPISGMATGINTPSLAAGIPTPSGRRSQSSSPRHSTSSSVLHQKPISSPLASPVDASGTTAATTREPPVSPRHPAHTLSTRTANSSARESLSSVSTANYHWMDGQDVESGVQDAISRDSILMLFPSPTTTDPSSQGDKNTPAPSPTTAPTTTTTTTTSPTVPARPAAAESGEPIFNMEQMAQQSLEQQAQQHALLKYFFKGNYHAPLNKDELGSVLDVGCGAGLWMRDMAIEFPLTEIHGVDAVVPIRKRRPRVPPNAVTPNTGSPNLTPFASNHSSLQSSTPNGSSLSLGASTKLPPAMLDSMPSNCFFHKADTTRGLPFPDNTFDFCRVRLILWGYNLNSFPDLLTELVRVTKKSGWIEFVDMDPCIKKANETGTRINEWIKTGLIHGNLDPDLVRSLPKFLREYCDATMDAAAAETLSESQRDSQYRTGSIILPTEPYGLDQLSVSKISLPFGPWGGKVGELWQKCFTTFLQELEPLIMDATLSGLVMDQYHRQFQQEMQRRFTEAAAASEESEGSDPSKKERVTSLDQRLCTHLAWSNLIDQLIKDATISSDSLTNPASKATPYSHANFLSSVKEVRSYNNFYIAYAQKVDIVELKQQFLLSQLEQEILSPNLNMASVSTFPSLGAAAAYNRAVNNLQKFESAVATGGSVPVAVSAVKSNVSVEGDANREPVDQQSDASHIMANTLPSFISSDTGQGEKVKGLQNEEEGEVGMMAPTARKMNRYGLVASLTQDALENFNQQASDNGGDSNQDPAVAVAVATPPTPTSVAALSIRSNSRSSNRNGGTTPSGLAIAETIQSNGGMISPQVQSATLVAVDGDTDQQQQEQEQQEHQQDYFSHMPFQPESHQPSVYHQQQYHHHYQQQMDTVKRKNSLISTVVAPTLTEGGEGEGGGGSGILAPSALAATTTIVASVVPVVGVEGIGVSATKMTAHSEEDEDAHAKTLQKKAPDIEDSLAPGDNGDGGGDLDEDWEEEGSEILIALQPLDDIQDPGDPEPDIKVEPGALPEAANERGGEDTIEIINQVHDPCPAEPVIKPVHEGDVDADADVESLLESPLGHLTPVEGGDDDSEEDDKGGGKDHNDDEVVFVMMAPPGHSVPDPGHDPGPVPVPAPVSVPEVPLLSMSSEEAARVPLPE
ncbi:hypothetical protein BGZ96_005659 [Linnemannia gamsii]|uniref:Methyltransferase type 11 domain-containing protein n=1 Tax=Linnemannia gamsii TaxID=64522 RepID=A0ABQ7K4D0_9FUNG|nr:hypothetical protein BGZ96_005659 [Linnemannia gamsii]